MREITDSNKTTQADSFNFAQKCCQEIYVLSAGTIGGAAAEFSKHPVKTVGDTVAAGAVAVAVGAIATAELPVVSIMAAGTGVAYGAGFAWNLVNPQNSHNIERNLAFKNAISTAWTTSDKNMLQNSVLNLQDKAGADSLQIVQSLAVGGVAGKCAVRTGDFVRKIASENSMNLCAEAVSMTGSKLGASSKVPTWDEYVNFNRRHGPVTQKTVQPFELEQILKNAANVKNKTNSSGASDSKVPAKSLESDSNGNDSKEQDDKKDTPGVSLYFAERFGRFH